MTELEYTSLVAQMDGVIELLDGAASDNSEKQERLSFTEAEIARFPKGIKRQFTIYGCPVSLRKRSNGRYKCTYEIRYNRGGVHISASGKTLDKAKERFIERLNYIKGVK